MTTCELFGTVHTRTGARCAGSGARLDKLYLHLKNERGVTTQIFSTWGVFFLCRTRYVRSGQFFRRYDRPSKNARENIDYFHNPRSAREVAVTLNA